MPPFPELKDITPPVEPPDPARVVVYSIFWILVASALLIALVRWRRALRRRPVFPALPREAAAGARDRLDGLRARVDDSSAGDIAAEVSEIVRTFLHRGCGVLARFRTTEELLGREAAEAQPPLVPVLRAFAPVLRRSDAIRYAGAPGGPDEMRGLIEEARQAIDTAEREHPGTGGPGAEPPAEISEAVPPPIPPALPPPLPPPAAAVEATAGPRATDAGLHGSAGEVGGTVR